MAMLIFYLISRTAFVLGVQSWAVVTEIIGPRKLKILTIWPFTRKKTFADPCFRLVSSLRKGFIKTESYKHYRTPFPCRSLDTNKYPKILFYYCHLHRLKLKNTSDKIKERWLFLKLSYIYHFSILIWLCSEYEKQEKKSE